MSVGGQKLKKKKNAMCYKNSMPHASFLCAVATIMTLSTAAFGEQRTISIGDRRIAVYCDGETVRTPTVVLVPAGGRTAKDWATVQTAVSGFTRVCSYDHANF